jgi:AraC family transcriptional regulator
MEPKLPAGSFYGIRRKSCEARGIRLTETFYPPATVIPRHSHEVAYFGLVLEGSYTEADGRKHRPYKQSMLLFHPSREIHECYVHQTVVRILSIELPSSWLAHLEAHAFSVDGPLEYSVGTAVRLAVRLYREFQNWDDLSPLAIEGLALELVVEICRHHRGRPHGPTAPPWLRRVEELLQARFTENLTLNDIAQAVAVHPAHLARVFGKYYGCTVGHYVRGLRMKWACRALSASNLPLSQVALATGYSDQSHFSTAFKRHIGVSPAEYRKAFRQR